MIATNMEEQLQNFLMSSTMLSNEAAILISLG